MNPRIDREDSMAGEGGSALVRLLDQTYRDGPPEAAWRAAEGRLRKRLEEETVYYDRVSETMVGDLWIAVTQEGLAAVEFGGTEAAFVQRLAERTGRRPQRSAARTEAASRELCEYLDGRRRTFTLPVDLRHVTPFQRSVLQAARAIPPGQVATYGQIGRRIGRPRAARAIGQALGSNPVPIVVPCHRVLASDGSLGGYSGRGGVRTKRRLLQLEGALLA
jgi:methylated-DNA-[protein]-cysteine S-methyltransferase